MFYYCFDYSASGQHNDLYYLELFFRLLNKPKFDRKVFNNKKQQALSVVRRVSDEAELLSDTALREFIFGSHPYGRATYGNEEDLIKISLEQVIKKYQKTTIAVT